MEEKKNKKKGLLFIIIGAVAALVAAGVVTGVLLLNKNNKPEPSTSESEEHTVGPDIEVDPLVAAFLEEGDKTIEINEDVVLPEIAFVVGTKTLTGTGKITGESGSEYVIVLHEGATLILDGPTIDGTDGTTNGIYVSENATLEVKSGAMQNFAGHGVRVLGKAAISGGKIEKVGTNFVMVDENATLEVTGGEFTDAGEVGIVTGASSVTKLSGSAVFDGAKSNLVSNGGDMTIEGVTLKNADDYAINNDGVMDVKGLELSGAVEFGYIQNNAGALMTVSDTKMTDSLGDFVYNLGTITMTDMTFGECASNAFESRGGAAVFTLKNATVEKTGRGAFLNRQSEMNLENVSVKETTTFFVHNRAGVFNGKDVKIEKCGGIAFFNDFAQDKDKTGVRDLTLDGFEIGFADDYGIRNSGGVMKLSNGTVGKCTSYGLYVYKGEVFVDGCKFLGTTDKTRGVIQVGLSTSREGKLTIKDTDITGGARGITNQSELVVESVHIYGCVSAGSATVGAGINNAGQMVFNDGIIEGNTALSSGGAIYNSGEAVINGGIFRNNKSKASGGGLAGKGVMVINGGKVTGNVCENYGGGIYNSGSLTINSVTVSGNTANKGGGGFHNGGDAVVKGGAIINNKVAEGKSGANIYNSGTMSLAGGTMNTNEASPYDLYIYKGNVKLSGSPNIKSIYKASEGQLTVAGKIGSQPITYRATSFMIGAKVLWGTASNITNNVSKFVLPDDVVADEKYINADGVVTKDGVDLNAKEVELVRGGQVVMSGAFATCFSEAENGDTLRLISDLTVSDVIEFSQKKGVTVTDDGTKRTITFTTDKAGVYVYGALSTGTRTTVNFVGTTEGGLEFTGSSEAHSAAILVSDYGTLNVNGNVKFTGFSNVEETASTSKTGRTSGKYGAVIALFNTDTAELNIDGATFENNTTKTQGAAVYLQANNTHCSLKNVTITGEKGVNMTLGSAMTVAGDVVIDEVYTASPITLAGELGESSKIGVNLENYAAGVTVLKTSLTGDALKNASAKVEILNQKSEDKPTNLMGEDGKLYANPDAAVTYEAELYDASNALVQKGTLQELVAAATTGQTIKIIDDCEVTAPLNIAAKTITITDDGTAHTIYLADPTATFHVRGTKTSAATTYAELHLVGNAGITVTNKEGVKLTTAAFLNWQYSRTFVSGKVTMLNIENGEATAAKNESNKTSGSLGGVFFVNASSSAYLTVDGITIDGCKTQTNGAALYNMGYNTIFNNVTVKNCVTKNGYAVYNEENGTGDGRVLEANKGTYTGNTNGSGAKADFFNGGLFKAQGKFTVESGLLQKPITVVGAMTGSDISVKMASFANGAVVLQADSALSAQLAAATNCITLLDNAGVQSPEITLGEDGVLKAASAGGITVPAGTEAVVLSGTDIVTYGTFAEMMAFVKTDAGDNYTVEVRNDVALTQCVDIINVGKNITIKDDGTKRTFTITPDGSKAGFFLYAGSSTKTVLTIEGTTAGGLEFKSAAGAQFKSAAFVVHQYATLNVNGNVTVSGFENTSTSTTAPSNTNMSSYGRGAAFANASSGSATINLNGTLIKDCRAALSGAGYYCYNWNSTLTNVTIQNCYSKGNGGGVYVSAPPSGKTQSRIMTITNCTITGNTVGAGSQGADIYVDQSGVLNQSGTNTIGDLVNVNN